jgi:transcription-repair coupling factor (superfamily II helicase)
VPATYIPYEQAKVDANRRIAGARDVGDPVLLREEFDDWFGEPPEPLRNLIALQQARITLGQPGPARSRSEAAGWG